MDKKIKVKKKKKQTFSQPTNKVEALENALMKKALGYSLDEVVEEFQTTENEDLMLTKRKVTTKSVPPDTQALKILLAIYNPDLKDKFENLSDQELEEEKEKILNLLED